jgi:hypothetical protein
MDLLELEKEMDATLLKFTGMDRGHLEGELVVIRKVISVRND